MSDSDVIIGAPCSSGCFPTRAPTRGAPTELRELKGMSGDDADEAATGFDEHAFDGLDGLGAVGNGGVVYLDCALLYQALGLLAVGGEAGVDEEVEDADFACG